MSNSKRRHFWKELNKKYNTKTQYYFGIPLTLIIRTNYDCVRAKRYMLYETNQNIWIPNCYLEEDGTIKETANIDWIFEKWTTKHKIAIAKKEYDEFHQRRREMGLE